MIWKLYWNCDRIGFACPTSPLPDKRGSRILRIRNAEPRDSKQLVRATSIEFSLCAVAVLGVVNVRLNDGLPIFPDLGARVDKCRIPFGQVLKRERSLQDPIINLDLR